MIEKGKREHFDKVAIECQSPYGVKGLIRTLSYSALVCFSSGHRDFVVNVVLGGFSLRRCGTVTLSKRGSDESNVHDEISKTRGKPLVESST